MSGNKRNFSRRDFIKTAGTAGLGSVLVPFSVSARAQGGASTEIPEQMMVPTRPFGKTGVNVSILSLGGVLKTSDLLIFRQAFKRGNLLGYGRFIWLGKKRKGDRQIFSQIPGRP